MIITKKPLSKNIEYIEMIVTHHQDGILGVNGYFSNNQVIPMFDFDGEYPESDIDLLKKVLPDLAIFETKRGYHAISFTPIKKVLYNHILLDLDDVDQKFIGHYYLKGYPTLRIGKKGDSDPPKWTDLIFNDKAHFQINLSIGHLHAYQLLEPEILDYYKKYPYQHYYGDIPLIMMYW